MFLFLLGRKLSHGTITMTHRLQRTVRSDVEKRFAEERLA